MSYAKLHYHIVFATKGRRPLVTGAVLPRLVKYLGGIVRGSKGKLLEANGPEDHLHLAVMLHPQTAVSDLVCDIKANSSRWVQETFPDMCSFAWQDGYAAFSVSHSALGSVIDYIRNQREHHRKITFKEELIALLNRHEIEFDQRYV